MGLLDSLCRFCSHAVDHPLSQNIFATENRHLLKTALLCIPLQMSADDCYPKMACVHCIDKMNVVTEFQNAGLSAVKLFDKLLLEDQSSEPDQNIALMIKEEDLSDVDLVKEEEIAVEDASFPVFKVESYNEECQIPISKNNSESSHKRSPKKSYQCDECRECFGFSTTLRCHLQMHKKEKRYIIREDQKRLRRKPTKFAEYILEDPICNDMTEENRLQNIKCPSECNDPAENSQLYQYHCGECGQKFKKKRNFTYHMRRHNGRESFLCNVCGKRFMFGAALNEHIRTHTGERLYYCDVCSKGFIQKSNLVRHLLSHTGKKSFSCAICYKKYTQKGSLQRHFRTHTLERFQCHECDRSYAQRGSLLRHQRTHSGVKLFTCVECPKSFTRKVNLECHVKWHRVNDQ